jgi:hypothetical protein
LRGYRGIILDTDACVGVQRVGEMVLWGNNAIQQGGRACSYTRIFIGIILGERWKCNGYK